jgi:hypothetical protein
MTMQTLLPPSIATIRDTAFRGDTVLFELTVYQQGTLVDFSQGHLWCTGRWLRQFVDDQSNILFQVTESPSLQGQVVATGPGTVRVRLAPAASVQLPPYDSPVQIDVQWWQPVGADGDVWTIGSGTLTFLADVTRSPAFLPSAATTVVWTSSRGTAA